MADAERIQNWLEQSNFEELSGINTRSLFLWWNYFEIPMHEVTKRSMAFWIRKLSIMIHVGICAFFQNRWLEILMVYTPNLDKNLTYWMQRSWIWCSVQVPMVQTNPLKMKFTDDLWKRQCPGMKKTEVVKRLTTTGIGPSHFCTMVEFCWWASLVFCWHFQLVETCKNSFYFFLITYQSDLWWNW